LVPLARVSLTGIYPITAPFPKPLYPWPQLKAPLWIEETEIPRGWEYSVGYWIDGTTHHAVFLPSSRGVRNLPFLSPDEEMVIVAPSTALDLTLRDGEKGPSAVVHGRVAWRLRLDSTRG
jgi:hypothetical protein